MLNRSTTVEFFSHLITIIGKYHILKILPVDIANIRLCNYFINFCKLIIIHNQIELFTYWCKRACSPFELSDWWFCDFLRSNVYSNDIILQCNFAEGNNPLGDIRSIFYPPSIIQIHRIRIENWEFLIDWLRINNSWRIVTNDWLIWNLIYSSLVHYGNILIFIYVKYISSFI